VVFESRATITAILTGLLMGLLAALLPARYVGELDPARVFRE
jgi:ABC-type antimicrobial peptide transport system permease subunit